MGCFQNDLNKKEAEKDFNIKRNTVNSISIYFHKDFANGIYAWEDNVPLLGVWPGKTDCSVYAENDDYYEIIIMDKSSIQYLLLKNGSKATAKDQIADTSYTRWNEKGEK